MHTWTVDDMRTLNMMEYLSVLGRTMKLIHDELRKKVSSSLKGGGEYILEKRAEARNTDLIIAS